MTLSLLNQIESDILYCHDHIRQLDAFIEEMNLSAEKFLFDSFKIYCQEMSDEKDALLFLDEFCERASHLQNQTRKHSQLIVEITEQMMPPSSQEQVQFYQNRLKLTLGILTDVSFDVSAFVDNIEGAKKIADSFFDSFDYLNFEDISNQKGEMSESQVAFVLSMLDQINAILEFSNFQQVIFDLQGGIATVILIICNLLGLYLPRLPYLKDMYGYNFPPQGLFNNPDDEEVCVNALRHIDPPLVDSTGKWIDNKRGKKSMLVAWWDAAKQNGYVITPPTDRDLAIMLTEYFPGLDLDTKDAGIFRQDTTTRTNFQPEFLALMPKKKLT